MTTREALCAILMSILLLTAGFSWLFGPYGLIGGGAAVLVTTLFTDKREDDDG
ncbi:hypothetical protein [Streptomyces sp. NPDC057854]|uniref:hypothetical protein n=1 Tax=unclassified Streptomyces TaxID=2593676 RepID=UPI00368ADF3D